MFPRHGLGGRDECIRGGYSNSTVDMPITNALRNLLDSAPNDGKHDAIEDIAVFGGATIVGFNL